MLKRIQANHQMELFTGVHLYVSQSDAARILGVTVRMIQYWENQGLLHPELSKQGRSRKYTQQDLVELKFIKCLVVDHGYTIPSLQEKLSTLEAPYYYDPDDVFWDMRSQSWNSRGGIARQVWEASKTTIAQHVEQQLHDGNLTVEVRDRVFALFSAIPYVLEGRPFPKPRKKSKRPSRDAKLFDPEKD